MLPDFHPKPVFVSVSKVGLLLTTGCQVFLFNPVCQIVSTRGEDGKR
jgi:hypothetical protein